MRVSKIKSEHRFHVQFQQRNQKHEKHVLGQNKQHQSKDHISTSDHVSVI